MSAKFEPFAALHIPGDPVVSLLGDAYTEENAIKARQDYGLDKPVLVVPMAVDHHTFPSIRRR